MDSVLDCIDFMDELEEEVAGFTEVKPDIGSRGPVSPLAWVGGKHLLSPEIVRLMPRHVVYVEVFGGAGHVLFRKTPSPVEVLNDINGELINFFRVLQNRPYSLYARHRWALYSREEFYRLRDTPPAHLDEAARAWRFFYLNRCCFGGKMNGGAESRATFGTDVKPHNNAKAWSRMLPRLKRAHERLGQVILENATWQDIVRIYDRADTFFYLDPPYMGTEHYYLPGSFLPEDFGKLAEVLGKIKGKFLLSIGDCPKAREVFGDFALLAEPAVTYSLNAGATRRAGELFYGNYSAE